MKKLFTIALTVLMGATVWAGNPDRQGEAGAYELLLNPWARSGGLHGMATSHVKGVEGMFLNVAAMSRINRMEFGLAQSRYLVGAGINVNAFGFATKMGKNGTVGFAINAMDFGDINVTTAALPEGTGGTFSPSFFNLGLSYAHTFDKVSVGATMKMVSESISTVTANTVCLDAGVLYRTGNFNFGVSLRNIGGKMRFSGDGLSFSQDNPDGQLPYDLTYLQRASSFELPSQLNIGASYDFKLGKKNTLSAIGNFTSNAFSRDELGGGLELSISQMFALRGGYKVQVGAASPGVTQNDVYTGLCGGFSFDVPLKKGSDNKLGIDYSYLPSNPFGGTHNVTIRIGM
jgi:hypothetical protein